jgi:hypothetical protein
VAGKILFRPLKMEVIEPVTDVTTVLNDLSWAAAEVWGRTQGGVTLSQTIEMTEIMSDVSKEPVWKGREIAGSTLTVNLLEIDKDKLMAIFGGETDTASGGFKVNKKPVVTRKAVRFTTQDVVTGGLAYIVLPNVEFTCEADLELADSETVIPFTLDILSDSNGYKWAYYEAA